MVKFISAGKILRMRKMEKKFKPILSMDFFFDWDNLCSPYDYNQHEVLESALCYFPNASSDKIDIREKRIRIMEAMPTPSERVIQYERRYIEQNGPTFECRFTYDNIVWIRGIIARHGIRFSSKDNVSKDVKDKLIEFIKLHTPPEFHGEIHISGENEEV